MEPILSFIALVFTSLYSIAALILLGIGVYWLFNKSARKKQLASLRAKLDELKPTDPEYNQVRALYTSMMIDAYRWDFLHGSDLSCDGSSHHSDSGSHSCGDSSDSSGSHSD